MAVLAVGCPRLVARVEAATRHPLGRRAQPPAVRLSDCLADGVLDSIGGDFELREWPIGDELDDELAAFAPAEGGAPTLPGDVGDAAAEAQAANEGEDGSDVDPHWSEEPDAGMEFDDEFAFGFGGGFDEA